MGKAITKSKMNSRIWQKVVTYHAAIYAWETKANLKSCSIAAPLTGTFPDDDEILFENSFVTTITPQLEQIIQEKSKRKRVEQININFKLITDNVF